MRALCYDNLLLVSCHAGPYQLRDEQERRRCQKTALTCIIPPSFTRILYHFCVRPLVSLLVWLLSVGRAIWYGRLIRNGLGGYQPPSVPPCCRNQRTEIRERLTALPFLIHSSFLFFFEIELLLRLFLLSESIYIICLPSLNVERFGSEI